MRKKGGASPARPARVAAPRARVSRTTPGTRPEKDLAPVSTSTVCSALRLPAAAEPQIRRGRGCSRRGPCRTLGSLSALYVFPGDSASAPEPAETPKLILCAETSVTGTDSAGE